MLELPELVRALTREVQALRSKNARLKQRIEELERCGKKYVAPYSREESKADPQQSGRKAGQGQFTYKQPPSREQVTRVVEVRI